MLIYYYYNTSVLPDQALGWLGNFHVFRFRSVFRKVIKNRFFVLSSVCKKTGGKKPEIRALFFNFILNIENIEKSVILWRFWPIQVR
jgi:hypothetical protein